MTDQLLNMIDGKVLIARNVPSECCPPTLCNLDLNSFICSFFAYLPKGPLWDYWKRIKSQQLSSGSDGCQPYNATENSCCLTLIDHAVYTAKKLYWILRNPLQAAIWESNPLTAFFTRSNWLSVYGWSDCFSGPNASTSLGFPTPYQAVCNAMLPSEVCPVPTTLYQMSGTAGVDPNPIFDIEDLVKAACPPDLLSAVEYGILVALLRLQLGVIKNIDGLNFILAPLGASVYAINTDTQESCQKVFIDDCNQVLGTEDCTPKRPLIHVQLAKTSIYLPAGPGITEALTCNNIQSPLTTISASYYFNGFAMPTTVDCPEGTIAGQGTIWPAYMAAECILRSILPFNLNYDIVHV